MCLKRQLYAVYGAQSFATKDIQGGPKSKSLPNDQKIVLNRIKTCE